MYAWASAIFWDFADTGKIIPALIFIGVALMLTRWKRAGKLLTIISASVFLMVAVLPLSSLLMVTLENRFLEPLELPSKVDGIILLGGSIDVSISNSRNYAKANRNANRFIRFAELARNYPQARLLFSGAGRNLQNPDIQSETDLSIQILETIGIDNSRMEIESRATNTYENAILSWELAKPKDTEIWLLVTSAWHMPRAVGSFRQAGWKVVPIPTGHTSSGSNIGWSLSFSPVSSLAYLSMAAHEWFGLIVYRALGRTGNLFPSP